MLFGRPCTVLAKFNQTCVQTAPVNSLHILQTGMAFKRAWNSGSETQLLSIHYTSYRREWHSKELGILVQKHPLLVKIDHLRPEKIKFKD